MSNLHKHSLKELLGMARNLRSKNQDIEMELLIYILNSDNWCETNFTDEEILNLLPILYDIWLHLESTRSVAHMIDAVVKYMADNKYSVEDIKKLHHDRYTLLEQAYRNMEEY